MLTDRQGLVIASLVAVLGGCPGLPQSTVGDTDTSDDTAEVFVPLSLVRVFETVGEPAGGERVAIFGAGFANGSDLGLPEVSFGSAKGESVLMLDDGQINVTVPAPTPGLVDVTARLPGGQEEKLVDAYLLRGPTAHPSTPPPVATRGSW